MTRFGASMRSTTQAERESLGGLPTHDFRIDQTPLRMGPKFNPEGFNAKDPEEAMRKAFDSYTFQLDHSLGRCSQGSDDQHTLAECPGVTAS